jgi:hypothetical protein
MPVFRKRRPDDSADSPTKAGGEELRLPSTISRAVRINFDELNRRISGLKPGPLTGALHARVRMVMMRYRTERQVVSAVAERKHLFLPRR